MVPRAFHVSASCWQSGVCRSWLACVAVFRAFGRLSRLARVGAHRIFALCRARGSLRCGVCRQRFVLRAQATNFVALPGIQSSVIVLAGDGASCCRLTSRSRRTASPPLNSSVRAYGQICVLPANQICAGACPPQVGGVRYCSRSGQPIHHHCRVYRFPVVPGMVANLLCYRWARLCCCLSSVGYSCEHNLCALCSVLPRLP